MKNINLEKRIEHLEERGRRKSKGPNIILLKGRWYPLDDRPETLKACESTALPEIGGRWWMKREVKSNGVQ